MLASFLALILGAAARPRTGRELDEYLSRLERFGFAGGALADCGRDILLSESCGLADRARRIPLGTDSVCNLASITKQSTAAAILALDSGGVERRLRFAARDGRTRLVHGPPDAPIEAMRQR